MRQPAIYARQRTQREVAAMLAWIRRIPKRKDRKGMVAYLTTRGPRATHRIFPRVHDASRVLLIETLRRPKSSWWQRSWRRLRWGI